MNVEQWLRQAEAQLVTAGVSTARLDSLVLLEDALRVDRASLLAHPDMDLPVATQNVLSEQLGQRAQHLPLAYIRGKSEFYGREFIVTDAVLEPRPESETMIELLLRYCSGVLKLVQDETGLRIADVGTGSGALGITASLELPGATVDLLEVDERAIEVAKLNVIKFTSGNSVLQTDLLDGSAGPYDVLLCNLPYVPDDHEINDAAKHEPALALFAGLDGLDLYRKLFRQIEKLTKQPLLILCESFPTQHAQLRELAKTGGYIEDSREGFIQTFLRS